MLYQRKTLADWALFVECHRILNYKTLRPCVHQLISLTFSQLTSQDRRSQIKYFLLFKWYRQTSFKVLKYKKIWGMWEVENEWRKVSQIIFYLVSFRDYLVLFISFTLIWLVDWLNRKIWKENFVKGIYIIYFVFTKF